MNQTSIWIGWDSRELDACIVTWHSLSRQLASPMPLYAFSLSQCPDYHRPTRAIDGKMIDVLSIQPGYDGAMSTTHACARFWVPRLAKTGWALFMDGDMLVRQDISEVFHRLDPAKALYCVKHNYRPVKTVKKSGDKQSQYNRKNWSSFMIFNCDHPAHRRLGLKDLNTRPGRELHAFFWLKDDEIGELDPKWNWLLGHNSDPAIEPAVCHFTEGCPNTVGYNRADPTTRKYEAEWFGELAAAKAMCVTLPAQVTKPFALHVIAAE